ncbi:MAG: hypothetical protein VX938_11735, partial [Myxococcota bacterium]|nr:hypothetical protein [Myxococcota bacterium]
GGNSCPGDFETVYSGFLFGQHHSHSNPTERICIGTEDFDTSEGNTGDFMYVSTLHDNGGVSGLYPNTGGAIHCAWCCRP